MLVIPANLHTSKTRHNSDRGIVLTYILIFLAICTIVGPALWLIPSQRQREQMALRSTARRLGLQVELASLDDPDPDPAKYRSLSGRQYPRLIRCVALRKHRRRTAEWQEPRTPSWKLVRVPASAETPSGWRWEAGDPAQLSEQLRALIELEMASLPADVLAVSEEHLLLSAYWLERSGEAGLRAIESLMSELLSVPLTDPEEAEDDG